MFETLNLLPKTQQKVKRANQIVTILVVFSRVVVLLFLMVLVGEYGWAALTNQQIKNTKSQITALEAEIQQQSDIEGKYLYYQQVLNSATTIVEKRKNFLDSLSELYSRLEPGVAIEGVTFTDASLLFTGRAPNVQVFSKTLDNFRQPRGSQTLFGDSILQAANRDPDGKYSFKLEIQLLTSPIANGES
jgi:hypothetical protein